MSGLAGTTLEVDVVEVIDGDTIKIHLNGEEENLRILALDTEESQDGLNKPHTPLGDEAKNEVQSFIEAGSTITIEFPGSETLETCLERYRGNFGRPLVYVHKDGEDFQERMIRKGYSPYFTKYGYANFEEYHRRYKEAERQAQADNIGVWNQLEANGQVMRDYSTLCTWWELRAEVVETYRKAKQEEVENLLDSRLDYHELTNMVGQEAIVFTELRSYRRTHGGEHAIVTIGSESQPFKLFIRNAFASEVGQRILSLLEKRYVPSGSDGRTVESPRRSYAYIAGEIELYPEETGEPEIEVTSINQIMDEPPTQ
ncbi:thermonuclease family protein [Haladaptatus sp. DFWS20]|uniref:thermonuclease family protein n=1 Tax=Haladaptatus sp. DFWS20 TaxID=3403467 RepID=UPI003EB90E58